MHKLLIANRGEIACRIQRTCRTMGIATVAVFSEPDRESPFVAAADEAVALGGSTPAESYLRIDALIDAARRAGCDAVHPGYGFLAENAAFAAACADAGLTFVGPTPEAIAAMGSKIEAKRRMAAVGVPLLESVELEAGGTAKLVQQVAPLGFPLLVKASAGGGGRGMRIVREAAALAEAVEAAGREAQGAFGEGTLLAEPYVEASRHVEFQVFGDCQGRVVHLFERECSIQRRHQKLIEESPCTALDDALRAEMGAAAVRAAESIGYLGAGTVEFLLAPDGRYYFLEMNTRLQVEHPVTECLTGLDLVRWQIEVARGEPLPLSGGELRRAGHAIEARLCAEDPARDFLPTTGTLHRFRIPDLPGIRVDAGVVDGSRVTPYYDSMIAKVIAHAPTRREAAARLSAALRGAQIHGLRSNRELLVRVLEHPEFLAGRTDTDFLVRHDVGRWGASLVDAPGLELHAAAAALAGAAERRRAAIVLGSLPAGWRNNPSQPHAARYIVEGREIEVGYQWRRHHWELSVDGAAPRTVRVECSSDASVELEVDGLRRCYRTHRVGDRVYVDSPLGSSELVELDRFPASAPEEASGSLVAPLPGVINEVAAQVGARVRAGDLLLVIESMKMLHRVCAPRDGLVAELRVTPRMHVEAGAVLAVVAEPTA